jgi:hypothetical protein
MIFSENPLNFIALGNSFVFACKRVEKRMHEAFVVEFTNKKPTHSIMQSCGAASNWVQCSVTSSGYYTNYAAPAAVLLHNKLQILKWTKVFFFKSEIHKEYRGGAMHWKRCKHKKNSAHPHLKFFSVLNSLRQLCMVLYFYTDQKELQNIV